MVCNSDTSIFVYANGLFCCSVCALEHLTREEVIEHVNKQNPSGTTGGWMISDNEYFDGGEVENGAIVKCDRGQTRHWLLEPLIA